MSDQEAEDTFRQIAALLERLEMNWVVREVNETIRLGKLASEKIEIQEEIFDEANVLAPTGRRRSRESFTVSVDFTPKEKLLLLVDALRSISTDAAAIELATAELIAKSMQSGKAAFPLERVEFVFCEDEAGREIRKSDSQVRRRLSNFSQELQPLFKELQEAIDAD
jgi:hypothetical protein